METSDKTKENDAAYDDPRFAGISMVNRQRLRAVDELPPKYRSVFSAFSNFNFVQSTVFDCLLGTDSAVVVSAPTGAGKTVLFELAITRLIETCDRSDSGTSDNKIVYLAPVKALCSEKYHDWVPKFRPFGLRLAEITGDSSDSVTLKTIENVDLILTTPEKWDAMTRKWKDHAGLVELIKLFIIDEVHLLKEERRGPTLEAVVSRMKTMGNGKNGLVSKVRFVAASATIPNISDIAHWLDTPQNPVKFFKFDESVRPVNLKKIVLGYPLRSKDKAFTFDLNLSYKLKQVIVAHSQGKPTLIFCSSRKSVQQTSALLKKTLSFTFTREQNKKLNEITERIMDTTLQDLLKHGIAYHHAGLLLSDRQCVEEVFRSGFLPVLISTSTLAMGVNLPAHLVIVKSTEHYISGEWQQYSESQVLQMIGRAGRPQFDTEATAVIMTRDTHKVKYEKLVTGDELVESCLHNHLVEHLNSEISLGTITDIEIAMHWLKSTFLYVRAMKNPKYYGISSNLSEKEVESKLQAMCMREIHALEKYELICTSNYAFNIEPTENGKLMARYYIAFDTMKIFMKIEGSETLEKMLDHLTHCHEFQEIQLRRHEKPILNNLNYKRGDLSIRFPLPGKITTRAAKCNVLIQAILGSLPISEVGLLQESTKIIRIAERLTKGLIMYLGRKPYYQALTSALTLHKCIVVKMWENSQHVCRQLPGIGVALGNLLVAAEKTSFKRIVDSDPRTLERIINRQPPMGNSLQEAAIRMPQYSIDIVINEYSFLVLAHVELLNFKEVQYGNLLHQFNLIISADNAMLRKEIISDQSLVSHNGRCTVQAYAGESIISKARDIKVTLISSSIVGVDVQVTLKPKSEILNNQLVGESVRGSDVQKADVGQKKKNSAQTNENLKAYLVNNFSFNPERPKLMHSDPSQNEIPETSAISQLDKSAHRNLETQFTQSEDDSLEDSFDFTAFQALDATAGFTVSKTCTASDKGEQIRNFKSNDNLREDIINQPENPTPDNDLGFNVDDLFSSSTEASEELLADQPVEQTQVVRENPFKSQPTHSNSTAEKSAQLPPLISNLKLSRGDSGHTRENIAFSVRERTILPRNDRDEPIPAKSLMEHSATSSGSTFIDLESQRAYHRKQLNIPSSNWQTVHSAQGQMILPRRDRTEPLEADPNKKLSTSSSDATSMDLEYHRTDHKILNNQSSNQLNVYSAQGQITLPRRDIIEPLVEGPMNKLCATSSDSTSMDLESQRIDHMILGIPSSKQLNVYSAKKRTVLPRSDRIEVIVSNPVKKLSATSLDSSFMDLESQGTDHSTRLNIPLSGQLTVHSTRGQIILPRRDRMEPIEADPIKKISATSSDSTSMDSESQRTDHKILNIPTSNRQTVHSAQDRTILPRSGRIEVIVANPMKKLPSTSSDSTLMDFESEETDHGIQLNVPPSNQLTMHSTWEQIILPRSDKIEPIDANPLEKLPSTSSDSTFMHLESQRTDHRILNIPPSHQLTVHSAREQIIPPRTDRIEANPSNKLSATSSDSTSVGSEFQRTDRGILNIPSSNRLAVHSFEEQEMKAGTSSRDGCGPPSMIRELTVPSNFKSSAMHFSFESPDSVQTANDERENFQFKFNEYFNTLNQDSQENSETITEEHESTWNSEELPFNCQTTNSFSSNPSSSRMSLPPINWNENPPNFERLAPRNVDLMSQSSPSSQQILKDSLKRNFQQPMNLLPRALEPKRRRFSSASNNSYESDSGIGTSVCTNLSGLLAIHNGYSQSLRRLERGGP